MKRWLAGFTLMLMLWGCGSEDQTLHRGLAFREKLISSQGCRFSVGITADYGEGLHTFSMDCEADSIGTIAFQVSAPESISGITGTLATEGGKLTFDGKALAFDMLADGTVSPVSGPWILLKALRGGYLRSCGEDGAYYHIILDDSYADDALQVDLWLDSADQPVRGEVLWQGRRVLSMDVRNFTFR